ncbi:MAG: GNAT family N-acetyltransferase [Planctomycetaceae bacterium]|nr:GNAT family N-acetyltransferase [Planctomycetaceae bacterium]
MHKTNYFKRLRMQFDFAKSEVAAPELPDGYRLRGWHPVLLKSHAIAKQASFAGEMDCQLFPCLRSYAGCEDLVRSIVTHSCFLPSATWIIEFTANEIAGPQPVACIQGMWDSSTAGAIQNVGVVPEHRGFGLGRAILQQSLLGFQQSGIQRISLHVTAENVPALELYQSVGFECVDTVYRALPETTAI